MKEIIKEVLIGDVSEMIFLLKQLEVSWQDFSASCELSDEDTNFKDFCEKTGRDFKALDNKDIEAYFQSSLLYVMYKSGFKEGQMSVVNCLVGEGN